MSDYPSPSNQSRDPRYTSQDRTLDELTYMQDSTPTKPHLLDRNGLRAQQLRDRLVAATNSTATTSSHGMRSYKKVIVKMFVWENDDFPHAEQFSALADVFRTRYGYITHRCVIPVSRGTFAPQQYVGGEFHDAMQQIDKDSLLIVYYSGHGMHTATLANNECMWA